MDNLIFFRGTHTFTFTLPSAEKDDYKDVLGFEAYRTFQHLNELQDASEPAFTHAQAVAVSRVERWVFRGASFASVLVSPEDVQWILCFPVARQGEHYALQTEDIPPDGEDVFYYFTGSIRNGTPIRAVPDLDGLKFLSPRPDARMALVRAKDWEWDEKRNTVLIQPQDVAEIEIILDSEVRVL
jgi:hypothetical protein